MNSRRKRSPWPCAPFGSRRPSSKRLVAGSSVLNRSNTLKRQPVSRSRRSSTARKAGSITTIWFRKPSVWSGMIGLLRFRGGLSIFGPRTHVATVLRPPSTPLTLAEIKVVASVPSDDAHTPGTRPICEATHRYARVVVRRPVPDVGLSRKSGLLPAGIPRSGRSEPQALYVCNGSNAAVQGVAYQCVTAITGEVWPLITSRVLPSPLHALPHARVVRCPAPEGRVTGRSLKMRRRSRLLRPQRHGSRSRQQPYQAPGSWRPTASRPAKSHRSTLHLSSHSAHRSCTMPGQWVVCRRLHKKGDRPKRPG